MTAEINNSENIKDAELLFIKLLSIFDGNLSKEFKLFLEDKNIEHISKIKNELDKGYSQNLSETINDNIDVAIENIHEALRFFLKIGIRGISDNKYEVFRINKLISSSVTHIYHAISNFFYELDEFIKIKYIESRPNLFKSFSDKCCSYDDNCSRMIIDIIDIDVKHKLESIFSTEELENLIVI